MSHPLILVANPGSASRKYALFDGISERARLHFEWEDQAIRCKITTHKTEIITVGITALEDSMAAVLSILRSSHALSEEEHLSHIGLRIVAPGSYFLQDHQVDAEFLEHFQHASEHAPLHVNAAFSELNHLQEYFPGTPIFAISDSAFHRTKPDYAWNYGISLELADKHDIKRFGYHGLSVASAVDQLPSLGKIIVCHLGSGASITAVRDGKSIDTTMGFSPLEGVIMATRSGSLDMAATNVLKKILKLDDLSLEKYLNEKSGLMGLGGSADIRELLKREANGDTRAHLALETYCYTIQKAVGQMAAALDGADSLVFTGTVGERSSPIRARIIKNLQYLGFTGDNALNDISQELASAYAIHKHTASKPIYIVPTYEENEIVKRTLSVASA